MFLIFCVVLHLYYEADTVIVVFAAILPASCDFHIAIDRFVFAYFHDVSATLIRVFSLGFTFVSTSDAFEIAYNDANFPTFMFLV